MYCPHGLVLRAEDPNADRQVAVKVVQPVDAEAPGSDDGRRVGHRGEDRGQLPL